MKQLLYLLLCLTLTQYVVAQEPNTHKVISYNIWNGFDWGKNTEREQLFVNWMQTQNSDVAALQELCGFDQKKLTHIAKQYGHQHAVILKEKGYPVGITSKYPIRLIEKGVKNFWHGYLHCKIQDTHYFVVHLSPASFLYRQKEANAIVKKIQPLLAAGEKVIVLGDYNAMSDTDQEALEKRPNLLLEYQQSDAGKRKQKRKNLNNNQFDFETIQIFKTKLIDACYEHNPNIVQTGSFPTEALVSPKESIDKAERIDYQMISPNLKPLIQSATIVQDTYTQQISDHFPVVATYKKETHFK